MQREANLRPKDAATLIIIRDHKDILLGLRNRRHVFLPNMYVFPGGRVDPGDARVPSVGKLNERCLDRLNASCTAARARGLAMAAIRETFEETGLLLAQPSASPPKTRSRAWRDFYTRGFVPTLDKLHYLGRAITPPNQVRRFDARFFLCDAAHMHGELQGNGELENLQWLSLQAALTLTTAPITALVLQLLCARFNGADQATALAQAPNRALFGSELVEFY